MEVGFRGGGFERTMFSAVVFALLASLAITGQVKGIPNGPQQINSISMLESKVPETTLQEMKLFMEEKFKQYDQQLLEQGLLVKELQEEQKQLKDENKQQDTLLRKITEEKSKMQATLEELEARVEYLEAITRRDVPRSCQHLKDLGVAKSGEYLIDPDGPGVGDPPITAVCEMAGSEGITKLNHNKMALTDVQHCKEPGCDVHPISYDAPLKQIKALIDLSLECFQSIQYDCFSSPLELLDIHMAWWTGSNNVLHYYWDGEHDPSEHVCACDATGDCLNENISCNCDQGAPQWMSDQGVLTDAAALPVTQLNFGGLEYDGQQAKFLLGGVTCSGLKDFRATQSCGSLLKAGNTASGYYLVDGPDQVNYDLVQCNMDLEPTDPNFQVATQVKLAEYPVAFHVFRNSSGFLGTENQNVNLVIPFDGFETNDGNGMTTAGTFTAPISGAYAFMFTAGEATGNYARVQIRVDGVPVNSMWLYDGNNNLEIGTMHTVVHLRKGQKVDAFLVYGVIYGDTDIAVHFTGQLIHPTD